MLSLSATPPTRVEGMRMSNTEKGLAWGVISTTCECEAPEGWADDFPDTEWQGCDGECYDDAIYFAELAFGDTLAAPFGSRHLWRISGLPLWDGTASGVAEVRTVREWVQAVTVRGEWRLEWSVTDNRTVALRLWHHDAPTGGSFVATYLPETDDDDIGTGFGFGRE
jgi:hypothetical protein